MFKDIRNLKRQADEMSEMTGGRPSMREGLKQANEMMGVAKQQIAAQQGTGDLAQNGLDGQATIKAVRDTGMTMNENPMVEFDLQLQPAHGMPYDVTIQQLTSRLTAAQYTPGTVLTCKIDPNDNSKVLLVNPSVSG
jgi:hypothetical protein